MLKRMKVRGKLLLLLATPLAAVMVFAFSGVRDRTDATAFQDREVRLAEFANAGTDLSLAIQVERLGVLEASYLSDATPGGPVAAGGDAESSSLGDARAATNAELERWVESYGIVRGDLSDPALVAELDDLASRLPTTLSENRGTGSVAGTFLALASRWVDDTTVRLAGEAADLDLFQSLRNLNELVIIQSNYATITAVGAEAIFEGQWDAASLTLLSEAEQEAERSIASFVADGDPAAVQAFLDAQASGQLLAPVPGRVDSTADIQEYMDDATGEGLVTWLLKGQNQLTVLNALVDDSVTASTAAARLEAESASDEAQSFLVLAGSVVLLALMMAIVIGRSISRPLTRLTRSAEQLSSEELPALVESMRSAGRAEAPVLTPIEASGRDEVAQLAHAISEIQQVTIDVAEEQGDLLRRGISDIFVNLARRNQSLLDRQIDFIDQLESREENPDQLENLFRLDHLATRMRRNAESLLVLAGAEPTRRRGRPVEIVDVLRVAMGEIEDFSRIELMSVDPSTVAGSVAVDLAHLMSELMENATQFSPPDADVEVVGYRIADDSYQLTLADRGIGMSAEQIATSNKTLAEPPLVGLDLSRSLGFTVVSRLAHRLGVVVQLTSGPEGGVTAVITIPAEMVGTSDETGAPTDAPAELTSDPAEPLHAEPADTEPAGSPEVDESIPEPLPEVVAPTMANPFGLDPELESAPEPTLDQLPLSDAAPAAIEETAGPAKLPTRRPKKPAEAPTGSAAPDEGDLFAAFGTPAGVPASPSDPSADLFAPIDGGPALPTRAPAPAAAPDAGADAPAAPPRPSRDPAAVGAVPSQVTSAGLIRRTPKQIDVPEESKYSGPVPARPAAESTIAAANRSPDEVRAMLSRYRAGLRKGRGPESDAENTTREN